MIIYTLKHYEADAEQLAKERIAELRSRGMGVSIEPALVDGATFDPRYAAKWSALTRKYKAGFLIQKLLDFAEEYDVDMTSTLAKRVLQGWIGKSISNRSLIEAFGLSHRDASQKSADWSRLNELVDMDKESVSREYARCSAQCKEIKERVWKRLMDEKSKVSKK